VAVLKAIKLFVQDEAVALAWAADGGLLHIWRIVTSQSARGLPAALAPLWAQSSGNSLTESRGLLMEIVLEMCRHARVLPSILAPAHHAADTVLSVLLSMFGDQVMQHALAVVQPTMSIHGIGRGSGGSTNQFAAAGLAAVSAAAAEKKNEEEEGAACVSSLSPIGVALQVLAFLNSASASASVPALALALTRSRANQAEFLRCLVFAWSYGSRAVSSAAGLLVACCDEVLGRTSGLQGLDAGTSVVPWAYLEQQQQVALLSHLVGALILADAGAGAGIGAGIEAKDAHAAPVLPRAWAARTSDEACRSLCRVLAESCSDLAPLPLPLIASPEEAKKLSRVACAVIECLERGLMSTLEVLFPSSPEAARLLADLFGWRCVNFRFASVGLLDTVTTTLLSSSFSSSLPSPL
jgi:hypothetical protein